MTLLKLSEIIQGGQSCLPTFGHLFMILSRVPEPKLVVISLLSVQWQFFKFEALIFLLLLCSEIDEKINASTLTTCHFKASRDITTNFGSVTFGNKINKWPKVGRHDWPPFMISNNSKKPFCYMFIIGVYRSMITSVHL